MTNVNVTGATACTASPNLPTGLNIDSSTCTISGTPTVEAVNATYEINATIGGVKHPLEAFGYLRLRSAPSPLRWTVRRSTWVKR